MIGNMSVAAWCLLVSSSFVNAFVQQIECGRPHRPRHVDGCSFTIFASPQADPSKEANDEQPHQYHIREARYSDLSQVAELITFGFHPEVKDNPILRPIRNLAETDRLQSNFPYGDVKHFYFVATTASESGEEEVVGFCDIDFRPPPPLDAALFNLLKQSNNIVRQRPYLSDLSVHPNHRRMGIASTLMFESESRAIKLGFDELFLGVASTNESALIMYEGMGYTALDYFSGVGGSGEREYVQLLRRSLGKQ